MRRREKSKPCKITFECIVLGSLDTSTPAPNKQDTPIVDATCVFFGRKACAGNRILRVDFVARMFATSGTVSELPLSPLHAQMICSVMYAAECLVYSGSRFSSNLNFEFNFALHSSLVGCRSLCYHLLCLNDLRCLRAVCVSTVSVFVQHCTNIFATNCEKGFLTASRL